MKNQFKYDYKEFFISLMFIMGAGLLGQIIIIFLLHLPISIILVDLWSNLQRCLILAIVLNLYHNISRVYELLNYNILENKLKEVKEERKLVKAYPKYFTRSIPLYKEIKD